MFGMMTVLLVGTMIIGGLFILFCRHLAKPSKPKQSADEGLMLMLTKDNWRKE